MWTRLSPLLTDSFQFIFVFLKYSFSVDQQEPQKVLNDITILLSVNKIRSYQIHVLIYTCKLELIFMKDTSSLPSSFAIKCWIFSDFSFVTFFVVTFPRPGPSSKIMKIQKLITTEDLYLYCHSKSHILHISMVPWS